MSAGGAVDDGIPAADRIAARMWDKPTWSVADLVAARRGRSVSVVLASDDQIIEGAGPGVRASTSNLVDEVVVADTGSQAGRGELIRRALERTTGDLVVFADPRFDVPLTALVGPLLLADQLCLVKGFRTRPAAHRGELDEGGGRLTELLVRPALASLRPDLSGVIAPLGQEFAATRTLLSSISIAPGPSADIGILLDALDAQGIASIAQVGLGTASPTDSPLTDLGPIGRQIVATLMDRLGIVDSGAPLTSYRAVAGGFEAHRSYPTLRDLPPVSATTLPVS